MPNSLNHKTVSTLSANHHSALTSEIDVGINYNYQSHSYGWEEGREL